MFTSISCSNMFCLYSVHSYKISHVMGCKIGVQPVFVDLQSIWFWLARLDTVNNIVIEHYLFLPFWDIGKVQPPFVYFCSYPISWNWVKHLDEVGHSSFDMHGKKHVFGFWMFCFITSLCQTQWNLSNFVWLWWPPWNFCTYFNNLGYVNGTYK